MMQPWFSDAKLGIFIHWGIYSVKGIPESWSFFNGQISYEDYMAQAEGFDAKAYDAKAWAELFRKAGARYAVLTTKHHDGFALWDTGLSDLKATRCPAGCDLVAPFCEALREQDIKVGLYFSHLDWSHPDYASIGPHHAVEPERSNNRFAYPEPGKESPERWESFLRFHRGQLKELCTRFRPDLLWFDGDWEREAPVWRFEELRKQLHTWAPNVILNSRMGGHGDYATPEQGVPVLRPKGAWEFCMTMNNSWGYQPQDRAHKSLGQILRIFCECLSMGGNLLLGIGPRPDGSIPEEQVERLEGLGAWIARNQEAVYGTQAGLPLGHFYGPTSLSKDRKTLYLYQFDSPRDSLALKGVRNGIRRVSVLGKEGELQYTRGQGASWLGIPGVLYIDLPQDKLDPQVTVIKLELEGDLDLYRGAGGAIASN